VSYFEAKLQREPVEEMEELDLVDQEHSMKGE